MNRNDRVTPELPRGIAAAESDLLRFVSADELRQLARLEPAALAVKTITTWALILGALAIAARSGSLIVALAAFVAVSAGQHALFLLAHEGAHYTVARRKWLNDLLSDIFFAAPIFYTTEKYREGHKPHHIYLGEHGRDLEHRTWVLLHRGNFVRVVLETMSGLVALRAILKLTPDKVGARRSPLRYVVGVGLTNGALLAYCWFLGSPLAYFLLWLAPFFTLTQLLLIVRAIAEHQTADYAQRQQADSSIDLTPVLTRTFAVGAFERFLFAPVGAHHHEHHFVPGLPFSQLPRLHALLRSRGYYDARPECVQTSYVSLLRTLILSPADTAPVVAAEEISR